MLTSLLFASVLGALALPEVMRMADHGGDDADDEPDQARDSLGNNGDLLATAYEEEPTPSPVTMPETGSEPPPEATDEGDAEAPAESDGESGTDPDTVEFIATPGLHDLTHVDESTHDVMLNVPANSTGYLDWPGDPDADPPVPAALTFEVPDGAVEVLFSPSADLESDAYWVSADEGEPVVLSDLLLTDVPGLEPDDPSLPAEYGRPDFDQTDSEAEEPAEEDEPVAPDDPEHAAATPDLPADQNVPETDDPEHDGLASKPTEIPPSDEGHERHLKPAGSEGPETEPEDTAHASIS